MIHNRHVFAFLALIKWGQFSIIGSIPLDLGRTRRGGTYTLNILDKNPLGDTNSTFETKLPISRSSTLHSTSVYKSKDREYKSIRAFRVLLSGSNISQWISLEIRCKVDFRNPPLIVTRISLTRCQPFSCGKVSNESPCSFGPNQGRSCRKAQPFWVGWKSQTAYRLMK